MKDAEKCISIKPDFVKVSFITNEIKQLFFCFQGYSRKGAALSFLKRYDEAITVYEEGLKVDPNNQQLQADLETAQRDSEGPSSGLSFFSDPKFIAQMMTNPKARELLKDPETERLMKMMQQQPNNTA